MSTFSELLSRINQLAATAPSLASLQQSAVDLIADNVPYYNWVGFYMLDSRDTSMLVLGAFHGTPTQHVRIPVTEGICGAAVAQDETVVVDDVAANPRYLLCSIETKSEIVTPIRVNGRVLGEIDVDSHFPSAFQAVDRAFLEECATIVARYMEVSRDR